MRRLTSPWPALMVVVVVACGGSNAGEVVSAQAESEPEAETTSLESESSEEEYVSAATLHAVDAARRAYGLDPERSESAYRAGKYHRRHGLYLHEDEVVEVDERRAVQARARSIIDDCQAHFPESFAGGWIDPSTGDLYLSFVGTPPDGCSELVLDSIAHRVQVVAAQGTYEDLVEAKARVQDEMSRGLSEYVGVVSIDPPQNLLLVGIFSDEYELGLEQVQAVLGDLSVELEFYPMERPAPIG